GLTTRVKPVVRYNSQNDTFYFVWIEKRALKHTIRHQCLNTPAATYTQVLADGNTYIGFAEVPAASLGNASPFAADLANTQDTTGKLTDGYTTMRISDSTNLGWSPETIEVEDFLSLQNPDIACSYLTGECTVVFEAIRRTYTMECEDNNGVIEMSWEETSLDTVSNIYAIHDSDLTGDGITEKVNTGTEFASHYPAIGFDGTTQRYLVAWERHQTSVKPKIFGQILYSGGGLYSGNFQIGFNYETVEHGQTNPNITYDSTNGRFLVTWADARTGATSLENIDVFGQFVNGAGSLSGSNFPLTTNQYNQQNPSAAYNAFSQTFISVWADARNLGTSTCGSGAQPCGSDIYAIRYALGQPQITLYGESGSILNPAQISYGTINTSATLQKSFKIRNTGDDVLRLKCFSSISAPFSYVNLPAELSACDNNYQEINPNTEQTYNVTFSPTANGTFNTSFEIVSNAGYRTIYLTGTAQQASIEIPNLTGNTLNFDNVTVGTTASQSFRIRNNGQVGYNINGVQVSAPFAFDTANSPVLPYTLNAGSEAVFYISYTPSSATAVTRTVSISTDAGISTSFSVTGRGTGSSSDNGTDDGDDDTDGGGNGESGEPKGGCSAGGSANLPIALFALAGMARIVIRRKERR
ncbi:MAG: choice-of-anchor D domain-containing protein, partial [Deferribacterales bacterium]